MNVTVQFSVSRKDRMPPRLRTLCTVQRRRQQEGEAGTAGVCPHPGRKFLLPRLWWWSMKLILHETTAATVVLQGISRTSYKQTKQNLSTIFVVALRWIIRNKTIPCTYCGLLAFVLHLSILL